MPCCMPGDECVVSKGESFCMPNEPEDTDYAADPDGGALVCTAVLCVGSCALLVPLQLAQCARNIAVAC